jgi:hypothetical protein
MGLSLAIVKSIADDHPGAIEVDISLGVWTTMRLHLPVAPAHAWFSQGHESAGVGRTLPPPHLHASICL